MKSLFKAFKKSSKKEWLAKVEKDLKGKPVESLNWKINDMLKISPVTHAEDLDGNPLPLLGKRKSNDWEKGAWISVKNFKRANQDALFLLENGAESLCFELSKNPNKTELTTLLQGIQLEWVSIQFILPNLFWKRVIQSFISILKQNNYHLPEIRFSFHFTESLPIVPEDFSTLLEFSNLLPQSQLIGINGINFHPEKTFTSASLAYTLANANHYIEKWVEQGLEVKDLIKNLRFSIQLNDSYFINIAKIRALKILTQLLAKSWLPAARPDFPIDVFVTDFTQTEDENYNKIKATSQAMSAVIGGAHRLFIFPSDTFKNNKGTRNQQRLALNIQHLMELESYMDRVIDPAAGSYFLENLTDQIAENAWEKFKTI